jgi:hypothetical protein
MNLRNRLIWIAALSVAFAVVQMLASQRKAERELIDYLRDTLTPLVEACARETSTRGTLKLQVGVAPEGKLTTTIESVDVPASSEVQAPGLTACIRERAATVKLKQPLGGPEKLELTLPLEP